MSSRFLKTLMLAAVIVGGIWILVNRDRIRHPRDVVNVLQENLSAQQVGYRGSSYQPQAAWPTGQNWNQNGGLGAPQQYSNVAPKRSGRVSSQWAQQPLPASQPAPQFVTNVVRIASFKLNPTITNAQNRLSLELLADICRRYDAIAFQEISSLDNTWLAQLTDRMNTLGAQGAAVQAQVQTAKDAKRTDYFYISDRDRNQGKATQSAIVFNRSTLELDQSQWYTVNDPDNLLSQEPIVAWFRARGPASDRAFTFTLVNLKIDANHPEQELAHLGKLFRAIRNDGRREDDVLIVGDFHAGDKGLQPIRKRAGLTWVVSNRPTDTKHQSQFDNLVFSDAATVEFTGRGGVFDFMRHYNLKLEQALSISQHVPVWAEFSIFEGDAQRAPTVQGTPGRVAGGTSEPKL